MAPPRLENRLPPEGLLERDEHPLRELAWLLAASLATLALLVLATGLAARWLAPMLPFSAEVALAERLFDGSATRPAGTEAQPDEAAANAARTLAARSQALQTLADRIAAHMSLPDGMRITVRADPSAQVNAYATVGGHIRVFDGLLRRLDSEEALAALLAHEIAHVKHRHVATRLGHGLALAVLVSVVWPEGGASAAQALLGGAAQGALLGYAREQERQADAEALAASAALYGHAGGLEALFAAFGQDNANTGPAWLSTHPETADRLQALRAAARAEDLPLRGAHTPLPPVLRPSGKASAGMPG
jgi:Zn-dependent protease with chaperone function